MKVTSHGSIIYIKNHRYDSEFGKHQDVFDPVIRLVISSDDWSVILLTVKAACSGAVESISNMRLTK